MITTLKTKFRAWLIDLVREAIRSERVQPGNTYSLVSASTLLPDNPKTPAPKSYTDVLDRALNPSFEQMQAEALKAQEKYYEPA